MKFEYTDIFDGITRTMKAEITTDSSQSSYGQPIIILDDGKALDLDSYIILEYKLKEATTKEKKMFNRWLNNCFPIGFRS